MDKSPENAKRRELVDRLRSEIRSWGVARGRHPNAEKLKPFGWREKRRARLKRERKARKVTYAMRA